MKKQTTPPLLINSVSELHRLMALPKPEHPLVSLIHYADLPENARSASQAFVLNFYMICIKKDFKGKLKYGQQYYDFDEGVVSFISPGQLIAEPDPGDGPRAGWLLMVHPDFIRNYPLAKKMAAYGFFSYAVHEALCLSAREEALIEGILGNIAQEYRSAIDPYSQDVIVSYLEVLLNYSNRFYNRQFLTRKSASHDLLARLEALLAAYFAGEQVRERGLPTVQYVSDQLNVSPSYLSDLLRTLTGQSTQQHIHNALIRKAKETLTTTSLSVGEIAYGLGFEHPQSFSKLFKSKTNVSPLAFRLSFN